jgi:hypothetical protein
LLPRYPFIANEILKCEADFVLDYFFLNKPKVDSERASTSIIEGESGATIYQESLEASSADKEVLSDSTYNKETLDTFIKTFLKSENSKEPILAGYFQAILSTLAQKRRKNLLDYFFSEPEIAQLFLNRIEVTSVASCLKSLINFPQEEDYALENELNPDQNTEFFAERCSIYKRLCHIFLTSENIEAVANIKDIFCHLFNNFPKIIKRFNEENVLINTFFKENRAEFWRDLTELIFRSVKESNFRIQETEMKRSGERYMLM